MITNPVDRTLALLLAGLLFAGSAGASGRRPVAAAAPEAHKAVWIDDGQVRPLELQRWAGKEYVAVEQVARMAHAQLRWKPVSREACLSKTTGELCFAWERGEIDADGRRVAGRFELPMRDGGLFIPMRFLLHVAFADFSGTDVAWRAGANQLVQRSPQTVDIAAVENLGDRYRLEMAVREGAEYALLERSRNRVWIRFVGGRSSGTQVLEGDSVLSEIRIVQRRRSADLILSLGANARGSNVFFDKPTQKLVVEVLTDGKPLPAAVELAAKPAAVAEESPVKSVAPPLPAAPAARPMPKPVALRAKRQRHASPPDAAEKVRTIVVDAGHGGIDSGAIGARGTLEKDINLEVATRLADALEKQKSIRVIMTRTSDKFVPLADRTAIANEAKADLFVSIHCNSSLSPKSAGFEAYILAPEASDAAAAAVARVENSVVHLEAKKGPESSKIGALLASMAVYNFINESSKAARWVCRSMRDKASVEDASLKEANFFVLRGAQMPGMLLELEYLSHPVSEAKLRSSRYQDRLVKAILAGILDYDRNVRQEQDMIARRQEEARSAQR